jgi:beta-N-acetylhexosaminidase
MTRYRAKRPKWPLFAIVAVCGGLVAGAYVTLSDHQPAAAGAHHDPPPPPPARGRAPRAGCIDIASWDNARLAAETVAVPAQETDVASAVSEVAAGAGGVILFGTAASADLGEQIKGLDAVVPARTGLLVMTDEEGGGVQRMANLVGNLPWPSYMGANWAPAQIKAQVETVAKAMAAAGVNMDLAPVVDVDGRAVYPGAQDPDGFRSFSGETATVVADAVAYMRGLELGGVIPVLKHFPGLGGASANTDVAPADTLPWSELEKEGVPPFASAIDAGAPVVMVSNAIVPGLSTLPASLSPAVIEQELEGALGFKGLVITDSLSAVAISAAGYSVAAASVAALRAGADMVIYNIAETTSGTDEQFDAIVDADIAAVQSGQLTRSRLIAAAAAVLATRHLDVCS